jgi:hypothetical protein
VFEHELKDYYWSACGGRKHDPSVLLGQA